MKTLIVDDHLLFRDGLISLLKAEPDFDVCGSASSVQEAVDLALRLKPELILMDFSLPDGTGLEATQQILAELPECKIVFLTIYDIDDKLFAAIRQGAKGYLLKNLPISDLLSNLRALEHGEAAISKAMTTRILNEFAHTQPTNPEQEGEFYRLSPREREILSQVATGATNREIAHRLYLSENTVKHHIHNILSKLGSKDRRELVDLVKRHRSKN